MMRAVQLAGAFAAVALLGGSELSHPAYAQTKETVFLAGPKDHGSPGRHEYEKDLRVLAQCLENSPSPEDMTTKVYFGKAPKHISGLKNADMTAINSSPDRSEKEEQPLFLPDADTDHDKYDPEPTEYLRALTELTDKGVGVAVFHYSLWVEHFTARRMDLRWLGGVWVQEPSKNPAGEWKVTLQDRDHPILRGVKPWSFRGEIFCDPFLIDDARRTDLLIGHPLLVRRYGEQPSGPAGPEVAAWAYKPEGRGRGFAYGGLDYHDNMRQRGRPPLCSQRDCLGGGHGRAGGGCSIHPHRRNNGMI